MTYKFKIGDVPLGLMRGGDYGDLTIDVNGFYTQKHTYEILGITTPTLGNIGDPKMRFNISGRYHKGPFALYLQYRHISSGQQDVTLQASSQQILGVGSYANWNSSISYDITSKITAQIVVNNLFNQAPPIYAISLNAGAALGTYDYFGQSFAFKLKARL